MTVLLYITSGCCSEFHIIIGTYFNRYVLSRSPLYSVNPSRIDLDISKPVQSFLTVSGLDFFENRFSFVRRMVPTTTANHVLVISRYSYHKIRSIRPVRFCTYNIYIKLVVGFPSDFDLLGSDF